MNRQWRDSPQLRAFVWVTPCIAAWSLIPKLAWIPGTSMCSRTSSGRAPCRRRACCSYARDGPLADSPCLLDHRFAASGRAGHARRVRLLRVAVFGLRTRTLC